MTNNSTALLSAPHEPEDISPRRHEILNRLNVFLIMALVILHCSVYPNVVFSEWMGRIKYSREVRKGGE